MKVVDLINKLNEIGYDENTELTFDFADYKGVCYEVPMKQIWYGEDLTGKPYCNDRVDIEIDVDNCNEYTKTKEDVIIERVCDVIFEALNNIGSYQHF